MNDNLIERAEQAKQSLDVANQEIGEVAADVRTRWRMSIPANPKRDTDLIVSYACIDASDIIDDLLAEVERLTPRVIETVEELDALPVGSVVLWDFHDEQTYVDAKNYGPSGFSVGWRNSHYRAITEWIERGYSATVLYAPESR